MLFTETLLYNNVLKCPGAATDLVTGEVANTMDLDAGVMYRVKPSVDCKIWVYTRGGTESGDGTSLSEGETERFQPDENKTISVTSSSAGLLNVTQY